MSGLARWLVPLLLVAALLGQQVFALSGTTRLSLALHDSLHVPWFATVTLLLLWITRWRWWGFAIAVVLGFGLEAVQWLTPREPSWGDVLRNLIGLACGGLAAVAWRRRNGWFAMAAVVLLLVGGLPVAEALINRAHLNAHLPTLFDARDPQLTYFARPTAAHRYTEEALELELDAGTWSGVHLTEIPSQLVLANTLYLDVEISGPVPVELFVSMRIKPLKGEVRYTSAMLPPGEHVMAIRMSEVLEPRDATIRNVYIYGGAGDPRRGVRLRRVWYD